MQELVIENYSERIIRGKSAEIGRNIEKPNTKANHMSWIKEARSVRQSKCGAYCNLCRELKLIPVPFHSFDIDLYELAKKVKRATDVASKK